MHNLTSISNHILTHRAKKIDFHGLSFKYILALKKNNLNSEYLANLTKIRFYTCFFSAQFKSKFIFDFQNKNKKYLISFHYTLSLSKAAYKSKVSGWTKLDSHIT